MGRAEKLFTRRLGRKSKREQSDLSNPESRQCGGAAAGRTAAFWRGLSLKETSAVAKEGGIADISSVALYHRARKSGEWLRWMCEGLLEKLGTQTSKPEWLKPYRIRAIDGSHISEQGSTGSDWILHYSWEIFGLRSDYFEITPSSSGESVLRFPIEKGDSILADRHYGKAKAFDYIARSGGDFVMR